MTQIAKITIASTALAQAAELMAQIDELGAIEYDKNTLALDMQERIGEHQYLCLVAYIQGQAVGFKLGYALDDGVFYSWLGGVLPRFRQQGVAKQLLMAQEHWAKTQGYHVIKVKTRNCYKAMLIMLITHGYQIEALEEKQCLAEHRICLIKSLGGRDGIL